MKFRVLLRVCGLIFIALCFAILAGVVKNRPARAIGTFQPPPMPPAVEAELLTRIKRQLDGVPTCDADNNIINWQTIPATSGAFYIAASGDFTGTRLMRASTTNPLRYGRGNRQLDVRVLLDNNSSNVNYPFLSSPVSFTAPVEISGPKTVALGVGPDELPTPCATETPSRAIAVR